MAIALSHAGSQIFRSSSPSRELMVATVDGIVTLEREHDRIPSRWRKIRHELPGSHVSAILMVEPDLMLSGIFKGGIMSSADGGRSWERSDAGLTHNDVYSLGMTRLDGRLRLFAGTEPAHFYVSDDRGRSWTEMPALRSVPSVLQWNFPAPPHIGHVKFINVSPDDPAMVYAGIEQGGLLRSSDAGRSWEELAGFDDDAHRLMIDPRDARRIYLVTGVGVYLSSDRGANWERLREANEAVGAYPDTLVFAPGNPDLMIVGGARDNPNGWRKTGFAGARISRSRDGGRSWEILRDGLPAPEQWQGSIEAISLEEWGDSFSVFAATTGGEVYASDDGGDHWSLIADGLAPISKSMHYHLLPKAAA